MFLFVGDFYTKTMQDIANVRLKDKDITGVTQEHLSASMAQSVQQEGQSFSLTLLVFSYFSSIVIEYWIIYSIYND